jgi:hypothetical protein
MISPGQASGMIVGLAGAVVQYIAVIRLILAANGSGKATGRTRITGGPSADKTYW